MKNKFLTFAALVVTAACTHTVIDENAGNNGSNLGIGNNNEVPVDPPATRAVAMLYSEIDWGFGSGSSGSGSSGSSSSTGGGAGIDPNTLYVFIRNDDSATCTDPLRTVACNEWEVTVAIPPSLQTPGTIQLDDPRLISVMSVSGPNDGANDCWFGGGSFFSGTIEIVSIDQNALRVVLANTDDYEFDADGTYDVPRCQ